METLHIEAENELVSLAEKVLEKVSSKHESGTASVLALHGDLGSGKTTFMQTLAAHLGVTQQVTSPTFVVMKMYDTVQDGNVPIKFLHLCHIDAYRIESIEEMRPLRFEEILADEQTFVCIEWAEKIAELLPQHTLHMTIEITGEESRKVSLM